MPRNRTRQPGPIKRTIVTPTPPPPVARNLGARTQTVVEIRQTVRNRRSVKMTGAQRDSAGRRSDWSKPATLRPFTTPMTAAWDYSATTMPRGGVWPSDMTTR